MRKSNRVVLGLWAWLSVSSSESQDSTSEPSLVERGDHYYQNVCTACHNGDPSKDGTLGPAVAGSSVALLEAKVLRGEYPPGYKPKRDTSAMPRFEFLAPEIPGLAAYLDAPKENAPKG